MEQPEELDEGTISKRARTLIIVLVLFLVAVLVGSQVLSTDASDAPRTILADKLKLIAVDTDGDGNHDLEIAVSEIINIASFDDGTQGIWIGGDVTSLDPLSLTD